MYMFLLLEIMKVFIHCKCRRLVLLGLMCTLTLTHKWNRNLVSLSCVFVMRWCLWLMLSSHSFSLLKRWSFIFFFIWLHNRLGLNMHTLLFHQGYFPRWLITYSKSWSTSTTHVLLNFFSIHPFAPLDDDGGTCLVVSSFINQFCMNISINGTWLQITLLSTTLLVPFSIVV